MFISMKFPFFLYSRLVFLSSCSSRHCKKDKCLQAAHTTMFSDIMQIFRLFRLRRCDEHFIAAESLNEIFRASELSVVITVWKLKEILKEIHKSLVERGQMLLSVPRKCHFPYLCKQQITNSSLKSCTRTRNAPSQEAINISMINFCHAAYYGKSNLEEKCSRVL